MSEIQITLGGQAQPIDAKVLPPEERIRFLEEQLKLTAENFSAVRRRFSAMEFAIRVHEIEAHRVVDLAMEIDAFLKGKPEKD